MGQLASTWTEVVSLTAKLSILEDRRDKAKHEHEDLVRNISTKRETSKEHIIAERDGVWSCFHGVLQSVKGSVRAADEHSAGHTDTLTQLWSLFEEVRRVRVVSSSTGPSQEGTIVAELESVLEVNN